MSTLSYAAFIAKYETYFADNTSQAITEAIMREFKDDIADSFTLSGGLNWTVVQIGDWNMDSTTNLSVAHGLSDYTKIRFVIAIVRSDAPSSNTYPLNSNSSDALNGGVVSWDATNINLRRLAGGLFDSTTFDSTSYNRGWINIAYVN